MENGLKWRETGAAKIAEIENHVAKCDVPPVVKTG